MGDEEKLDALTQQRQKLWLLFCLRVCVCCCRFPNDANEISTVSWPSDGGEIGLKSKVNKAPERH